MNYRDPKESQSIFETRTLQTQCRWKVIAYGVKANGFSTGFPGMRYVFRFADRPAVMGRYRLAKCVPPVYGLK